MHTRIAHSTTEIYQLRTSFFKLMLANIDQKNILHFLIAMLA